jgi:hypothetical protein
MWRIMFSVFLVLAALFVCRTYNLVMGENEITSRIATSKALFTRRRLFLAATLTSV